MTDIDDLSAAVGRVLQGRGQQLGVAESLTGGMLANHFASAPGASDWFLGAVVSYTKAVKFGLLDVPEGPVVTAEAAEAMAAGALRVLGADVAVSVTGAGGPDEQDGQPPGTVFSAVQTPDDTRTSEHHFDGEPVEVCRQAADAAVRELAKVLDAGV
jgi:nicotinamide-nucleotide amidase